MRQTNLAQVIELKLGRPLSEHVVESRRKGLGWRPIAAQITDETGVKVSWETLRSWFSDELHVELHVELRDRRASA